ncbi:TonB-dependent hemoglobin/transferrin/lactoferrin family receptor [Vibrio sp. SCSIO 43136]|uniref:TonB-dependent hemoglobin/transferrin/lactoferrin family receptor n=1 Tax=Vibrio sp. SCSIO 43136 TaxID=2819101 RepID=UPI002074F6C9|nr:TonB-dependent hemoglobin/transferrin/lactoferrin family receptor [Vibrio sp. SCSIO 43136]USD68221.1 TonB-dependent hemoglobin/transferrin/lactoferrin family receptor [Vibrio sp. SCSIO 43136]
MSHNNFKKPLLTSCILLALSQPVFAQSNIVFDEVVVSATKIEQDIKDVSATVEKVSSDDIDNAMATDLKQALKYTPGVEVNGTGRFGISSFNIRGMDGSRVKVMVDGVQQAVPYNPGAAEQRHYSNAFEVDTLASIEVNKGPSSSIYGADALGGAVLLRTKNPSDVLKTDGDEQRFGIKSGYTSADNTFKNTVTWAARKDQLETLLMLTYADGNETKAHHTGDDIDGASRGLANPADKKIGNLLAKAYYQLNDAHRIGATIEYHQNKYDEATRSEDNTNIGGFLFYNNNRAEDTHTRMRVGIEHEWLANAVFADDIKWSLNYQDHETINKNYELVTSSSPMFNYGNRLRERTAQDKSYQFDLQANKVIEAETLYHLFSYGGSYQKMDYSLENTDYYLDKGTSKPGSTQIPNSKLVNWGAFINDQIFMFDDRLILNAGLRYDSFSADPSTTDGFTTEYESNSDSAFTGKIGAVYHLNENLSTFAQISQGFKAPTVEDLYYFYNSGAYIAPNPNLKAERSTSYEIGLRGSNELAKFELVGFHNKYDDFITTRNTGETTSDNRPIYEKVNLDKVEISGVEFGTTVLMDEAFSAPRGVYTKFSIAHTVGKDLATGKTLDSIAPLKSVFGLGYDNYDNNFGGIASVNMAAAKTGWETEDNLTVPGYATLDLTAYYQPMYDLTLRAGLFNAFDTKYWLFDDLAGRTSTSTGVDRYTQPGRNWSVSVEYFF